METHLIFFLLFLFWDKEENFSLKKAKNMNLHLVTLSGFGKDNPLSKIGDYNLCVESTSYNIVETTHQVWLLAIIDYLIEN